MGGFLSDAMAVPTNIMAIGGQIGGIINQLMGAIRSQVQKLSFFNILTLVTSIFAIGKCIFGFFDMIFSVLKWGIYEFPMWLFTFYMFWFFEFVTCSFDKMMQLPKCFLWYGLDTATWIMYLPFRFVFWLMDELIYAGRSKPGNKYPPVQQMEHNVWNFLDDIDHFIHDKGGGNLGTGFHLIHFPDSVMSTCYRCKIRKWKSGPALPMDKVLSFFRCITGPF